MDFNIALMLLPDIFFDVWHRVNVCQEQPQGVQGPRHPCVHHVVDSCEHVLYLLMLAEMYAIATHL
jgi:hypothetical protein